MSTPDNQSLAVNEVGPVACQQARPPGRSRVSVGVSWLSLDRVVLAIFLAGTVYIVWFLGAYGHVARNRINDSWWHIAAADEYLHTNRFAADPFIADAPPFAQFGLAEVITAGIARATGRTTAETWPWTLAFYGLLVCLGCYACGWWISGSHLVGAVAVPVWFVYAGELSVHGLAMPFLASLPCQQAGLLWVLLASRRHRWTIVRAMVTGGLVAFVFAMHGMTGLWMGGCVAMVGVYDLYAMSRVPRQLKPPVDRRERRRDVEHAFLAMLLCAVTFAACAFPWIRLQVGLRTVLDVVNSHQRFGYGAPTIVNVGVSAAAVLILAAGARRIKDEKLQSACVWFSLWGLLTLVLITPPRELLLGSTHQCLYGSAGYAVRPVPDCRWCGGANVADGVA